MSSGTPFDWKWEQLLPERRCRTEGTVVLDSTPPPVSAQDLEDYAVHRWYYGERHVELHTYHDPPYENAPWRRLRWAKTRRIPFKRYAHRVVLSHLYETTAEDYARAYRHVFGSHVTGASGVRWYHDSWGHHKCSNPNIGNQKRLLRVYGGYSNRKLRRMRMSVIRRKARELWLRKFAGPSCIVFWIHAAIDHEAKRIYTTEAMSPAAVRAFLSHQEALVNAALSLSDEVAT